MENNNDSFNIFHIDGNSLNNDLTFSQTITKKQIVELDNLNNVSEKHTLFSDQVVDENPLETKTEQLSYDYTKPHREILRVKQI